MLCRTIHRINRGSQRTGRRNNIESRYGIPSIMPRPYIRVDTLGFYLGGLLLLQPPGHLQLQTRDLRYLLLGIASFLRLQEIPETNVDVLLQMPHIVFFDQWLL